ncbi:MAG: hypothetical protein KA795_18895 [Burkholderiaceae bacterium]|nr:hypothetical protein [Burkholderiaceae bacterium]
MSIDPDLAARMGPPPFAFAPADGAVDGPAFSPAFKLLATLIVGGCAWFMYLLWQRGGMAGAATTGIGWFIAALALLVVTWWFILTSRSRVDSQALTQSWIWNKRLDLRELAYCRLIRVRGLDWLIAPRLYARTLLGKFAVFYAASPELIAEFERLSRELSEFRGQR